MSSLALRYLPVAALLLGTSLAMAAPGDIEPGWHTCGWAHSQHLSANSDAGGDVKNETVACTRRGARESLQTFEFGLLADTPPAGLQHPVAGTRMAAGFASNQRDTYALFFGYGASHEYRDTASWGYHVRAGELNGYAGESVRSFWDKVHRDVGGRDNLRHSPVSSRGRMLVQATLNHTADWASIRVGSRHVGILGTQTATLGTQISAATLGVAANIRSFGSKPFTPSGIAGNAVRLPEGTGAYAGLFWQATGYELATRAAGTVRNYAYARVGASLALGRDLVVGVELLRPLADRVQKQTVREYSYLATTVGYRF